MRPPQSAGEDAAAVGADVVGIEASMRPPQSAGEDGCRRIHRRRLAGGFNEAPAICGGRPRKWA